MKRAAHFVVAALAASLLAQGRRKADGWPVRGDRKVSF
jgi:hypothetical protein